MTVDRTAAAVDVRWMLVISSVNTVFAEIEPTMLDDQSKGSCQYHVRHFRQLNCGDSSDFEYDYNGTPQLESSRVMKKIFRRE